MGKSRRQQQRWPTRFKILERSGFRCSYCGVPAREAKLVLDHSTPLAANGEDHARNITAACGPCNSSKGAELLNLDAQVTTYIEVPNVQGIAADVLTNDTRFVSTVDIPTGPQTVMSLSVEGKEQSAALVEALRRAADDIEAAL